MSKNYSGSSISELCKRHDIWSFYIPPILASKYHSVLYELPANSISVPQPHINSNPQRWDVDHVRMPFSSENLYPVKDSDNSDMLKPRWEIICKVLEKPIRSVGEFEGALHLYNLSLPRLTALEYFFEEVLGEDESDEFFENLLPKIIKLALSLPEILPGSIPLLKKEHSKSISLSQLQVSSLLANAFLCTFPWRKEVAATYPGVNFVRLYSAHHRPKRLSCIAEKLKCIIHYFRRVTNTEPTGVITFERIFIPRNKIPRWDTKQNNLGNTRIHITSTGTIEDDGLGFLQVDFANKNIGGGVLGYGCVQEEIRFVICPELLVCRLFAEQLGNTEAVVVRGIERFSKYSGYGDNFKWNGNFVDTTPFDYYGRRQTTLTIIDATRFNKTDQQYYPTAVLRELNKAYVGFYSHHTDNLAPVATGNWGCGAFNGDPKLKILIQLMACNAANRDLVYYSFGNEELQETFYNMYLFIATNRITTCELWRMFCRFAAAKLPPDQLYSFIQQSYFDYRSKPEVVESNTSPKNDKTSPKELLSFAEKPKSTLKKDNINIATTSKIAIDQESSNIGNLAHINSNSESTSSSDDIIPSSQPENNGRIFLKKAKEKASFNKKFFEENHNEILDIFNKIDGSPITNKNDQMESDTLLSACEKIEKIKEKPTKCETVVDIDDDSMDVDGPAEESVPKLNKSKTRITDYFSKLGKS